MSRLATARDRLEQSVSKLEAALEAAVAKGTVGSSDADALGQELAAVKADYAKLAKAADQVDARLDTTIDKLEAALAD